MQLSPATKGLITRKLKASHYLTPPRLLSNLRTILERDMPREQAKHAARRIVMERGL